MANNKSAEKYAQPHTMSGKPVGNQLPAESVETGAEFMNKSNMSVGTTSKGAYAKTKTEGVPQRGHGAATKGYTSRGPMA